METLTKDKERSKEFKISSRKSKIPSFEKKFELNQCYECQVYGHTANECQEKRIASLLKEKENGKV